MKIGTIHIVWCDNTKIS